MKAWVSIPVLLCVIALVPPLSADCESDYQDDLLDCDSKCGMFEDDKMIAAEASRSLRESAAELEGAITALGRQARQLRTTLDDEHERARHIASQAKVAGDELRWALKRPRAWPCVCGLTDGFWGALFAE